MAEARVSNEDTEDTEGAEGRRALEAGPEPLGDALTTKLWLARLALIVCVVMAVVVFFIGSHPYWQFAFPILAVVALVEVTLLSHRRAEWDSLMQRRREIVGHR